MPTAKAVKDCFGTPRLRRKGRSQITAHFIEIPRLFKEASLQCVQNCVLDLLETAAANVCRDPKSGPHFQGGQHPDHPFLRSNKGPDLVGLKFMDDETPEHPIIEPDSVCGRRFKPACDGAPRHPLDSSHG